MTDQEYIYKTDLNINYSNNLIEGRVYGHVYDYIADERTIEERREATKFEIYVRMIWNYRYGENSANGHLTQYTQFRSERHGAEKFKELQMKRKQKKLQRNKQQQMLSRQLSGKDSLSYQFS